MNTVSDQYDYLFGIKANLLDFTKLDTFLGNREIDIQIDGTRFLLFWNWCFSKGSGNLCHISTDFGVGRSYAIFKEDNDRKISLDNSKITLEIDLTELFSGKLQWGNLKGTFDTSITEDDSIIITARLQNFLIETLNPDVFKSCFVNVKEHYQQIDGLQPSIKKYGIVEGEKGDNSFFYYGLMFKDNPKPDELEISPSELASDYFFKISDRFFLESSQLDQMNLTYTDIDNATFSDYQEIYFKRPYYFPRMDENDPPSQVFSFDNTKRIIQSATDKIRIPEANIADNVGVDYTNVLESKANQISCSFNNNNLVIRTISTIRIDKEADLSIFGIFDIPEGDENYLINLDSTREYKAQIWAVDGEQKLYFIEDKSRRSDNHKINITKSGLEEFFDKLQVILDDVVDGFISIIIPTALDILTDMNPIAACVLFTTCGELAKVFTKYEKDKHMEDYFNTFSKLESVQNNFQKLLPIGLGEINITNFYIDKGLVVIARID